MVHPKALVLLFFWVGIFLRKSGNFYNYELSLKRYSLTKEMATVVFVLPLIKNND